MSLVHWAAVFPAVYDVGGSGEGLGTADEPLDGSEHTRRDDSVPPGKLLSYSMSQCQDIKVNCEEVAMPWSVICQHKEQQSPDICSQKAFKQLYIHDEGLLYLPAFIERMHHIRHQDSFSFPINSA